MLSPQFGQCIYDIDLLYERCARDALVLPPGEGTGGLRNAPLAGDALRLSPQACASRLSRRPEAELRLLGPSVLPWRVSAG